MEVLGLASPGDDLFYVLYKMIIDVVMANNSETLHLWYAIRE